jgi:CheY-like chemotaxis protein
VIVLDVTMETMGAGFRAAREIRGDDNLRDVPLIMLTSINQRATGLRYGADEEWNPVDVFLDKPLAADTLVDEVRKLAPQEDA